MKRLTIVVTAAAAAAANGQAKAIDAEGGEKTWTVPLSPDGREPATHYWCSWELTEQRHDQLEVRLDGLKRSSLARLFSAESPDEVLRALGLQAVQSKGGS